MGHNFIIKAFSTTTLRVAMKTYYAYEHYEYAAIRGEEIPVESRLRWTPIVRQLPIVRLLPSFLVLGNCLYKL